MHSAYGPINVWIAQNLWIVLFSVLNVATFIFTVLLVESQRKLSEKRIAVLGARMDILSANITAVSNQVSMATSQQNDLVDMVDEINVSTANIERRLDGNKD